MLTLRPYQQECVDAHYDFFARNPEGNPLFVVPTGGGKSLIIAEFIKRTIALYPKTRILILTHVRELISQNHDEFLDHLGGEMLAWPLVPTRATIGVYSAGMRRRDIGTQVLFAGIQSVYERADELGHFDLVLIDEAHLVPKKGLGRYRRYLSDLRNVNPKVRVCGYTATHFRLDGGYLHEGEGQLFTDVAYEVPLELLIKEDYLVPVVALRPEHVIDATGVAVVSGDFRSKDLEELATAGDLVEKSVEEVVEAAREHRRRCWLLFTTGLAHAGAVLEQLERHGVTCRSVFGNTPKLERDQVVHDFKEGGITAVVNVGVMTTGFNVPRCDLMAVMRPTKSTALYVQIFGRGMRTFPGKKDCLVLDFGLNVERHGPLNRVRPTKGTRFGPSPVRTCPECKAIIPLGSTACPNCGVELTKICPVCATEVPVRSIECPDCGYAFVHHAPEASGAVPIDLGEPRIYRVDDWWICAHNKASSPTSMRVELICGAHTVKEWVCFEHDGYAKRQSGRWWQHHGGSAPLPNSTAEALQRLAEVTCPVAVEVVTDPENAKFERVRQSILPKVGA